MQQDREQIRQSAERIVEYVHDMMSAGAADAEEALDEARRVLYSRALKAHGGNQSKAASSLRLNRDRFRYFIKKKLGL